jgi:hypothetical protein
VRGNTYVLTSHPLTSHPLPPNFALLTPHLPTSHPSRRTLLRARAAAHDVSAASEVKFPVKAFGVLVAALREETEEQAGFVVSPSALDAAIFDACAAGPETETAAARLNRRRFLETVLRRVRSMLGPDGAAASLGEFESVLAPATVAFAPEVADSIIGALAVMPPEDVEFAGKLFAG